MIVEISDATKKFTVGNEVIIAIDNLSLAAAPGEFVCVYGASGSGKSTLISMLAGLDIPDSGDVVFDGGSFSSHSESRRASIRLHKIGVIFQSNNLLAEFTAQENVALPLMFRGMPRHKAETEAQKALSLIGLGDVGQRFPTQLSGGQRQRIGIARALAGEQELLLADEPTGALDSHNSTQLFGLMRALCDERGTAVILATHDPLAMTFADSIYDMVDGKIAAR